MIDWVEILTTGRYMTKKSAEKALAIYTSNLDNLDLHFIQVLHLKRFKRMTIRKTIAAGLVALGLIAGPVVAEANTNRIIDRVGDTQESKSTIDPAILMISAGLLLAVIITSGSQNDKSKSN